MDFREYDYISRRPDTFPRSTLNSIRKVLSDQGSENVRLIDRILSEGYVTPPEGYKWHGVYRVFLSEAETQAVLDDLTAAESKAVADGLLPPERLCYLKQYVEYWSRILHEALESYDEYKAKQLYIDLRDISLDAFLNVIFDHPVVNIRKKEKPWYWNGNKWIEYDKEHVTNLYIELFHNADKLLTRFSKDKVEQGLWAVMGGNLEFGAYELIHDEELDVKTRERLISSMYFLYEKLFFDEPLDTSGYMWWDSLSSGYYEGGSRDPLNSEDDKRIQDAIFNTLVKVLSLESEICQGAALHGLGHLRHPDTEKVIKDFIKKHKNLTEKQIDYANACIMGDIM